MRIFYILLIFCTLLLSCNRSNSKTTERIPVVTDTALFNNNNFFPVTAYIKGQLYEIREKGISPLKYTMINDHTDSVWLKTEELEPAFHEFLDPVIDTANLRSLFTETKLLDQTINAFSFTYDPLKKLPDSLTLRHWDVYIDPETHKVKRIYLVKDIAGNKTMQLTWIGNKWCKIVTIANLPGGKSHIDKEVKITWDF